MPLAHSGVCALGGWVLVAVAGCGPVLELPSADDSATTQTEDDTTQGMGSTGLDDGASGEDDTGEGSNEWCSHGVALTEISSDYRFLSAVDNDGDGRDELWMHDPQHRQLGVFQADDSGVPVLVAEYPIEGTPQDMGDIDGDGRKDVIVSREGLFAWIPAEDGLGLASEAVTLELPPPSGPRSTWLDADGDGDVDYVENVFSPPDGSEVGYIRLHMNDGAGGFFVGDALGPIGFEYPILSLAVLPSIDSPGHLLIRFEEYQGFIGGPIELHAIEVSSAGQIEVLAHSQDIPAERVVRVRDLDGNGVPDVVSLRGDNPSELSLTEGRADGTFELTQTLEVTHAVVHDFDGDDAGRHDILYLDSEGTYLRAGADEGFSEPLPLRKTGVDASIMDTWPVQTDGVRGHELLERLGNNDIEFALLTIGPCN